MRSSISRRKFAFLLILVWISAIALLSSPVRAALALGRQSFGKAATPHLQQAMSMKPAFFRRVGGVAFAAVATGEQGLRAVDLRYRDDQPDGSRLEVKVISADGHSAWLVAHVPDWILVPTAHFASDPDYNSCVTLFGELNADARNTPDVNQIRDTHFIANYHQAFADQLLGLRLLQADMMAFYDPETAADLFKNEDHYVLGTGEDAPNIELNLSNFRTFEEWREHTELAQGKRLFDSFVITDDINGVRFTDREGLLVVSGNPHWSLWKNGKEYFDAAERHRRAVDERYRAMIEAKLPNASLDAQLTYLLEEYVDADLDAALRDLEMPLKPNGGDNAIRREQEDVQRIQALLANIDEVAANHAESIAASKVFVPATPDQSDADRVDAMLTKVIEAPEDSPHIKELDELNTSVSTDLANEVEKMRESLEESSKDMPINHLHELSKQFSKQIAVNHGLNPSVYEALTQTMRYAALFRHVRNNNKAGFARFVRSLDTVSSAPALPQNYRVETPTLVPR